ncbi:MAG: hypothetical protein WCO84_06840 [bacterium]
MRRIVIIIAFTFILINVYSEWVGYYPDGKKIQFKFSTAKDIFDSLKIYHGHCYDTDDGCVWYKGFTNTPLFILLYTPNPLKIKTILSSYNHNDYLFSYHFFNDLKVNQKEGKLTKKNVLEYFGNPDVSTITDSGYNAQIFKKFNLRIVFIDSLAKSFDVINYLAIQKNEFSIMAYEVTGNDYSLGFSISVYNQSKKTIKYLHITTTAYNPVDDIVGTKTVKAIGPIYESDMGSYEFKEVFYSETATRLRMVKIKVEYMDGSFRELNKTAIKNVRLIDWENQGYRTF